VLTLASVGEGLELELTGGRRFIVTLDHADQAGGLADDLLRQQESPSVSRAPTRRRVAYGFHIEGLDIIDTFTETALVKPRLLWSLPDCRA
jgi:hypothetical protein